MRRRVVRLKEQAIKRGLERDNASRESDDRPAKRGNIKPTTEQAANEGRKRALRRRRQINHGRDRG